MKAHPLASAGVLVVSSLVALGAALTLPASTNFLLADGGTLRVANVPMGAYRINVYTDPTPITPDSIDVSILATFERGRGVAIGLDIQVLARLVTIPGDGRLQGDDPMGRIDQPPRTDLAGEMAFRRQATREQAEDPRFYAAKFSLGAEGDWEITVVVEGPEGAGEVSFEVVVRQAGLLGNPYLILFLSLVPIGLVGWWLRRSSDPSSPSSRPEG